MYTASEQREKERKAEEKEEVEKTKRANRTRLFVASSVWFS